MKKLISLLIFALLVSTATVAKADPVVVDLIAGQNTDVGDVTIVNDTTNLYVEFAIVDDDPLAYPNWKLVETHLGVAPSLAGIPQTKNGNPKVGAFTLGEDGESGTVDHDPPVTTYMYTIPLADLGIETGGALIIAAHANIQYVEIVGEPDNVDPAEPDILHKEGAWGSGEDFTGKTWAMYVE